MVTAVFCGMSVDGYIARPDGTLDFLDAAGGQDDHGYAEFIATVDAILMGRRTYEVVLGFGGPWAFTVPVYVWSRTPLAPAPEGAHVEQVHGGPRDTVARLGADGVQRLYLDGGQTVQAFLREGLVHHLIVSRVPVLIGRGIPLFGELDADVPLRHVRTRTFPSGLVQDEYRFGVAAGG